MKIKLFDFNFESYLKKNALALEISDSEVTILSLKNNGDKYFPETWGNWTIPSGIIEKGRIKNQKALLALILNWFKKIDDKVIFHRPAIVSIPEETFFSRVTHISENPSTSDTFEKIIEKEIEDHFPLYPSEVYYDYNVLNTNPKKHIDIFLGASPKTVINEYVNLIKSLNLYPFIFEGESLAISRAIINFDKLKIEKPTLFINIGNNKAIFIIYFKEAPRFTAVLYFSFSENTNKKQKFSLDNKLQEGFLDEIDRYLSFYEAHPLHEHTAYKAVSKVIISGCKDEIIDNLSASIAKKLTVPVEICHVNNMLRLYGVSQLSPVVVGLAFRAIEK